MLDGASVFIGILIAFVACVLVVFGFSFGVDHVTDECRDVGVFTSAGVKYECRIVGNVER